MHTPLTRGRVKIEGNWVWLLDLMIILINGSNEMPGYELMLLSLVRRIKDETLRFHHITRKEEASLNHVCLIVI